jgi:hypothetical protein
MCCSVPINLFGFAFSFPNVWNNFKIVDGFEHGKWEEASSIFWCYQTPFIELHVGVN